MKTNLKRTITFLLAFMFVLNISPLKVAANEFNYTEIITPIYDNARSFSGGLAAVQKDGKWGYIDTDGKTIIDFKYDSASSFRENKAIVGTEKLEEVEWMVGEQRVVYWGIIDKKGNYTPLILSNGDKFSNVIYSFDLEEDHADYFLNSTDTFFHNGMVIMSEFDGPYVYAFDINGKQLYANDGYYPSNPPTEGLVPVYALWDDFSGYVDWQTGKLVFEDKGLATTRPFNQNVAAVGLYDQDTYEHYWTFMNRDGKLWDIKFNNFYIRDTTGEYRIFGDNSLASIEDTSGKWGAINIKGETVLPFKYDMLKVFTEGLAGFSRGGKFGFVDIYGNEVIKPQFDDVSLFNNGLAVVRQGNKAHCIDKKGNKIAGTEALPVSTYFKENGYNNDGSINYTVYSPGKYVVINKDSKYGFGEIEFTPSPPTAEEMSSWALDEILLAIENNLVPVNLQNMYKTNITRVDFAALVVKAIEKVMGEDIKDIVKKETGQDLYQLVSKYPFRDTSDTNVIVAQALGIINGKAEGKFAPYDTISRQDAAALLMRTSKFLGEEIKSKGQSFSDSKDIANYAKEAVDYISGIEVMQGTGNNKFSPLNNYSREQAYMTIYRLFNVIINK